MNRNKALLVKQIGALIGKYNSLAAERGMQKMPYPPYGNALNDMSRNFLLRDLKAISNAITEIEEIPVEELKTARGVKFTSERIIIALSEMPVWRNGLWCYIQYGDDICVYGDRDKIINKIDGEKLELDYEDMPYEMLVDEDGKKWTVNSYSVYLYDEFRDGLLGVHRGDDDWYYNVCNKLKSVTIKNWTNRNVTNMSWMFTGCHKLTSLNLSNFNTSKVKDMLNMFGACEMLTSLNLSSFNTSNVTNMSSMFYVCPELTTLNLSSFDTSKVTNMSWMFAECSKLTSLTLGENFIVPSSYNAETKTGLAPSNECTIMMNENVYNAFNTYDLASYTFSPNSWNASGENVQQFSVTPTSGG